jgi:hypothetical protein
MDANSERIRTYLEGALSAGSRKTAAELPLTKLGDLEEVLRPLRGVAPRREEIETAIQALLFHQLIYEDSRGIGNTYDLVRRHRDFFIRNFSAMGHRLVIEPRERMVGLLVGATAYGWRETRLLKDETMVLLALRFVLETGTLQGRLTESGRVEATTDELFDAIRTFSRTEPPGEGLRWSPFVGQVVKLGPPL